jgi:hypothetical protein
MATLHRNKHSTYYVSKMKIAEKNKLITKQKGIIRKKGCIILMLLFSCVGCSCCFTGSCFVGTSSYLFQEAWIDKRELSSKECVDAEQQRVRLVTGERLFVEVVGSPVLEGKRHLRISVVTRPFQL